MVDALPDLVRALRALHSPAPDRRLLAARTLNASLTRLSDFRPRHRAARLRLDRRIAAALVPALADPTPAVRSAAAWALAAGKTARPGGLPPRAFTRLLALLRDPRPDSRRCRRFAAFVLGRMRATGPAIPALLRMSQRDPNREARAAATQAVASIGRAWVRRNATAADQAGHRAYIVSMAQSSDGGMLLTGGADGTVRVWDRRTGRSTAVLSREGRRNAPKLDWVCGLTLSPDDRVLAVVTSDVTLLDLRTGKTIKTFDGRHDAIVFCSQTLRGTGGRTEWVRLVDERGRTTRRVRAPARVSEVTCSPDGKTVAVKADGWTVLDATTGHTSMTFPQGTKHVAFSPDGVSLVAAYSRQADLWEFRSNRLLQTFPVPEGGDHDLMVHAPPAFSPAGDRVAFGQSVWQTATGALDWIVRDRIWTRASVFSPDGRQIALAGDRHAVSLRSAATGEAQGVLGRPRNEVQALAVARDGRSIAARYEDGRVRVWERGRVTAEIAAQDFRSESLVFGEHGVANSPDGRLIARLVSGKVHLHDAGTREPIRQLPLADSPTIGDWICSVVFSPSGDLLATGADGFYLTLWDTATWEVRRYIDLPSDSVSALAFSPDGRSLAVVTSYEAEVELRDVETGALLGLLEGHAAAARAVAYTPDGSTIVTGAADGTVRFWDAGTGRPRTRDTLDLALVRQ